MAPVINGRDRRRSVRQKSSPRGFGISNMAIRKPTGFRGRKPVFADRNQVDVLQKGLKLLNSDGDDGGPSAGPGADRDVSRKAPMKVAVRVRPLNARETSTNAKEIISVNGSNMLVFDPERKQDDFFYRNQKIKDVTARKFKNLKFAFDHVYDNSGTNIQIYEEIMKPLLNTLMSGFNCSVFAYGATGSGKTYTMLGSAGNPGLTYLTINDLYERLDSMKEDFETEIVIAYFEVYNEQVRDLLNPTGEQLVIMEAGNGIDIKKLSYHHPVNIDHLLEMLRSGNANRSQHPTDHNSESSRSHAVLEVHIRVRERHKDISSSSRTSKLVMVDLAGSEKGCATGFTGQRFREGSSINKSLLALGKVMESLASGKKTFSFRDSKLTRILKDSLGGNCRTVMIANISPAETLYDDTLNTLRYAQKAKKISCNASKNIITVQSCLTEYTRVVDEMTAKIQGLEKQLKEKDIELEGKDQELREKEDKISELELRASTAETRLNEAINSGSNRFCLGQTESRLTELEKIIKGDTWGVPEAELETELTEEAMDDALKYWNEHMANMAMPKNHEELNDEELPDEMNNSTTLRDDIIKTETFNESYVVGPLDKSPNSGYVTMESFMEEDFKFNTTIKPMLEKIFFDFNLKVEQYCQLQSMSTTTADERYGKALNKVSKKLETICNSLQVELRNANELLKSTSTPLVVKSNSVQPITLDALTELLMSKIFLGAANNENQILQKYVTSLYTTLTRREDLLKDFALLSSKLLKILKHFDQLAPSDKDHYDKLVSAFCTQSLHFKENSPFSKGIMCTNLQEKRKSVEIYGDEHLSIEFDQCNDVLSYFKIAEERLGVLLEHVKDNFELNDQIEKILQMISSQKSDTARLSCPPVGIPPGPEVKTGQLCVNSVESQSQETDSSAKAEKDDFHFLMPSVLRKPATTFPLSNETFSYDNNEENVDKTAGDTANNNKDVLPHNNTFTLEDEVEVNENDDPHVNVLNLSHSSFTGISDVPMTVSDYVTEILSRTGATTETKLHQTEAEKDNEMSRKSIPKIDSSPGTSNTGCNSASLKRKIPVRNLSIKSSSPKKSYTVGVGAKKVIASTGKIQSSCPVVPQKRSPYAKSKKVALATVRSVPPAPYHQKLLSSNNKTSLQQQRSTWLKGPSKTNLNGPEGR